MLRSFIFVLFLFISHQGFSNSVSCNLFTTDVFRNDSTISNIFKRTYLDEYTKGGHCYFNIWNFVNSLKYEKGVDLNKANVLYIIPEKYKIKKKTTFEVLKNRQDDKDKFRFHVVFELHGKIYDYDYSSKPNVLDVEQYFEEMFNISISNQDSAYSGILIRKVPALEYHQNYSKVTKSGAFYDGVYYVKDSEGKYPIVKAEQYLKYLSIYMYSSFTYVQP